MAQGMERRYSSNVVHDLLEVSGIRSSLHEGSGTTDERVAGSCGNDTVSLTTLATGGVVTDIGHVLVDSEGLSSDGRLITSNQGDTLVNVTLIIIVVIIVLLLEVVGVGIGEVFLVSVEHLGL